MHKAKTQRDYISVSRNMESANRNWFNANPGTEKREWKGTIPLYPLSQCNHHATGTTPKEDLYAGSPQQ